MQTIFCSCTIKKRKKSIQYSKNSIQYKCSMRNYKLYKKNILIGKEKDDFFHSLFWKISSHLLWISFLQLSI